MRRVHVHVRVRTRSRARHVGTHIATLEISGVIGTGDIPFPLPLALRERRIHDTFDNELWKTERPGLTSSIDRNFLIGAKVSFNPTISPCAHRRCYKPVNWALHFFYVQTRTPFYSALYTLTQKYRPLFRLHPIASSSSILLDYPPGGHRWPSTTTRQLEATGTERGVNQVWIVTRPVNIVILIGSKSIWDRGEAFRRSLSVRSIGYPAV